MTTSNRPCYQYTPSRGTHRIVTTSQAPGDSGLQHACIITAMSLLNVQAESKCINVVKMSLYIFLTARLSSTVVHQANDGVSCLAGPH